MKKATKTTKSPDTKTGAKKKTCSAGKGCSASAATAKKAAPKATTAKKTSTQTAASSAKKSAKKMTRIVAHVNVGWGNMLYIRGEGAGLSWEQGVPMICNEGSEWHWIAETGNGPISFKFLVNDEKWALGENVTINAGDVHISDPIF